MNLCWINWIKVDLLLAILRLSFSAGFSFELSIAEFFGRARSTFILTFFSLVFSLRIILIRWTYCSNENQLDSGKESIIAMDYPVWIWASIPQYFVLTARLCTHHSSVPFPNVIRIRIGNRGQRLQFKWTQNIPTAVSSRAFLADAHVKKYTSLR